MAENVQTPSQKLPSTEPLLTVEEAEEFLLEALKHAKAMIHKLQEALQIVEALKVQPRPETG